MSAIDVTSSTRLADARITFADSGRQEQVVTASPLPDRWVYDLQTNTVTGVFNADESSAGVEQAFAELSEQWRSETAYMSLASEQANSFAYHQIIGMGKDALPLIFRELRDTTSDWFWALRAITRTNVNVKAEDKGNVHKIAEAWLEWGKRSGYVR